MIKKLPYYLIPQIMNESCTGWDDMSIEEILFDFYKVFPVEIEITGSDGWQEESDVLDLELNCHELYKNSTGSFFITWNTKNWKCKGFWYSGEDENGDDVFESWNPKGNKKR